MKSGLKKQLTAAEIKTLEQLPVAAALYDNEKFYFLNQKAAKLLGVPKNLLKSPEKLSFLKLFKEGERRAVSLLNKNLLSGKKQGTRELEITNFSGKELFLEVHSNLVKYDGRKLIQAAFFEITQRKKTEQLLNETKEKFELITNNAHDIISFFTYQPREKYLYVSPNIRKILGFTPEELVNDNNFFKKRIIGSKADFERVDAGLKNVQKRNLNKTYSCTFKSTKKTGEEVWIDNSLVPIIDEKGKVRFFLNVLKDITVQKEKEMELQLQYSNYQNLLDNAQVAYAIHEQGTIVYCNNELLRLLKLKTKRNVLGKFAADFFVPEERKVIVSRINELYRTKKLEDVQVYKMVDSKNHKVEVEIRSSLVNYNNSNCIVSSILNVSQQRQLEREKLRSEMTEQNNKLLQREIEEKLLAEKKLIERTGRLSAILENSSHMIWTVNKERQVLSFNKNFSKIIFQKYGYRLREGDKIDEQIKVDREKYIEYWYPKYDRAFNGETLQFEREDLSSIRAADYRKIYINPIYDKQGRVIEVSCMALDITEAKIYEQKLTAQSARLNAIFESGSHIVWTINKNREITSCNRNFEEAVSQINSAVMGRGVKHSSYILDEYEEIWKKQYDIAFSGKSTEFITERNTRDNNKIIRQIYLQPIFNQDGKVEDVSGIAHDITDKKRAEQKIYNQAAKLNAIFESSHHYIWTIDTDQKLTSFNKNYLDLISNLYDSLPYIGLVLDRGILSNNKEYNDLLKHQYEIAFSGVPTNFGLETLDKNQKKIYLDIFLNPISENSKVIEVSGIAHDVSSQNLAQQEMVQSLKEKEVLLKEVHHRVKNNMQVISSILNLQSTYVSDEYTLSLLKESQNRIKTMAYIHESLYQNKSFTSVNFSDYISTLSHNIIQSYSVNQERIQLLLNLEKINLSLDNSIPAGLIVNELITNAIKHAFGNLSKGIITINLKSENNTVYLEVKDNGMGFDPSIDFKNTNSLGLQLVNTLVDQIGAELVFKSERERGSEILIAFKM
jgi:PAS domain S-box-containing protein